MAGKKKTRVAIVRCDTHAYWFGAFMDECDPEILASYSEDAPTRQAIHNYFKAGNSYNSLKIERVPGFVIAKVYDRIPEKGADENGVPILQYGTYPGRAEAFSDTFPSRPEVCETIEEAADGIDAAYIADSSSPKDGSDHLELARPFLERGIPCFVDKFLGPTLADAREMIRLAEANSTVLMSASILAHTEVGEHFRRRFDEIGEVKLIVAKGVGSVNAAFIHGLALAQGLVGYGVESVECMGSLPQECILLQYPNGLEAYVLNTSNDVFPWTCTFYCSAYSKLGVVHSPGIGDPEFHTGTRRIVELFRQMIDTGKPPIPYEHILEPIAILEASRIAQESGKRVALRDVM